MEEAVELPKASRDVSPRRRRRRSLESYSSYSSRSRSASSSWSRSPSPRRRPHRPEDRYDGDRLYNTSRRSYDENRISRRSRLRYDGERPNKRHRHDYDDHRRLHQNSSGDGQREGDYSYRQHKSERSGRRRGEYGRRGNADRYRDRQRDNDGGDTSRYDQYETERRNRRYNDERRDSRRGTYRREPDYRMRDHRDRENFGNRYVRNGNRQKDEEPFQRRGRRDYSYSPLRFSPRHDSDRCRDGGQAHTLNPGRRKNLDIHADNSPSRPPGAMPHGVKQTVASKGPRQRDWLDEKPEDGSSRWQRRNRVREAAAGRFCIWDSSPPPPRRLEDRFEVGADKRKKKERKRQRKEERRAIREAKRARRAAATLEKDAECPEAVEEDNTPVEVPENRPQSNKDETKSKKNDTEMDAEEDVIGPRLPASEDDAGKNNVDYGKALRPGEGSAMAAFVQDGARIPRRGEIGLTSDEISAFEAQGYVMSGSRNRRMEAVRIRKENQIYSAEELAALSQFSHKERKLREERVLNQMRMLVESKLGDDASAEPRETAEEKGVGSV